MRTLFRLKYKHEKKNRFIDTLMIEIAVKRKKSFA